MNQKKEENKKIVVDENLKKRLDNLINYSRDEIIKKILTTYVNYSGEIITDSPESIIYIDNRKNGFIELTQINQKPLSKMGPSDYYNFHLRKEQKTNTDNVVVDITIAKDGNSTRVNQVLNDKKSHKAVQFEKHFVNNKLVSHDYTVYAGDCIINELHIIIDNGKAYVNCANDYTFGYYKRLNYDYEMMYSDLVFEEPYDNSIDCLVLNYIKNNDLHPDFVTITPEEYEKELKIIKNYNVENKELDVSIER